MNVVFVHGWSVTTTDTYGQLPAAIVAQADARGMEIQMHEIFLGRYISFHDEVEVDDIARAFQQALNDALPDALAEESPIACITHSTGGPVVRTWVERYYGVENLSRCLIKSLVMLAPANQGSTLAVLGKARVSRIKAFFDDVEPGEWVLNWLELGSTGQWQLNDAARAYRNSEAGFYPFVITGQTIDAAWYDNINSYTGERGGDGVVRVAAANLNYSMYRLVQGDNDIGIEPDEEPATALELDPERSGRPVSCGLSVVPNTSHTGGTIGIMESVTTESAATHPVVSKILNCLEVENQEGYVARQAAMDALTEKTQTEDEKNRDPDGDPSRFSMLVFRVSDDQGRPIEDFDLFMLAGPTFAKGALPKGFFVDRQRNPVSTNTITYFVNTGVLNQAQEGAFGIRVIARPAAGFACYSPAEWHSTDSRVSVSDVVRSNETTYIDIIMKRPIDRNTFRLGPGDPPKGSFKDESPSGVEIEPES